MEIWEKITWIMIGIGIICNLGAIYITQYALTIGYTEANLVIAQFYEVSVWSVLGLAIIAYTLMILIQRSLINKVKNKKFPKFFVFILPTFLFVVWGADFLHDVFLIYFGINEFTWINNLLIWNQFLK